MKVNVSYLVEVDNWFDVPKEFEFFFTKDEEDWTDDEWDVAENGIVSQILMRNNIDFDSSGEIFVYEIKRDWQIQSLLSFFSLDVYTSKPIIIFKKDIDNLQDIW